MGYTLSIRKKGYFTPDVVFRFKDSDLIAMVEMTKIIAGVMGEELTVEIEREAIKCCGDEYEE